MNHLFGILVKTPFAGILFAIIIGILVGSTGISAIYAIITLLFAFILFIYTTHKSKSPLNSFRFRNLHWLWIFLAFLGVGIFSSSIQFPQKIELSSLKNFGYGEIISISHKAIGEQFIVRVDKHSNMSEPPSECQDFLVQLSTNGYNAEIGDIIRFPLEIKDITNNENKSGYDYADYMLKKGIRYKTYSMSNEIKIIRHNSSLSFHAVEIRDNIISFIETSSLKKDTQNFLTTILLGDKEYINNELQQSFANSGVAHILALSGLHTGIIAIIISYILFPLNFIGQRKLKYCIVILGIWIFAFVTGFSPSVVRASVMISFVYLAQIIERKNNSFNALFGAATLILIISPYSIYDVGAQLSFISVLRIILFANKVNFIDRRKHQIIYSLVNIILITIIATLGSWPLISYYFHKVPILFLPLNILAIPLLPIYLGIAIIYIILISLNIDIQWIAYILDFCYNLFAGGTELISNIDFATIDIWISSISIVFYFASLTFFAIALYQQKLIHYIYGTTMLIICILSILILPNNKPIDGFIIQNNWNDTYIRVYKNGKDSLVKLSSDTTSYYSIYHKTITFIDNNKISLMETRRDRLSLRGDTIYPNFKPIICDYILIGDGYHGTLNHILRHYNPIVIIIMPEVYKEKQISFMNEKLTRNTKIHFIKNDGTFSFFLK